MKNGLNCFLSLPFLKMLKKQREYISVIRIQVNSISIIQTLMHALGVFNHFLKILQVLRLIGIIMDYNAITYLEYECNCTNCGSIHVWNRLMEGAVRANKRALNSLVKKFLPDLHKGLALQFHNPYNYFRTETHLVLVHSAVEYFLKFESPKTHR